MEAVPAAYDAIVVGSGIGGLCAALAVSRAGLKVLVLEAGKQFGGYLNPFRRGKFEFDPGLHYIGECGRGELFDRILRGLEVRDAVDFRRLADDAVDAIHFPGYSVAMPADAAEYEARLARDFPHEREGLRRFFALLGRFRAFVGATAGGTRAPAARDLLSVAPLARYLRSTFATVLDDHVRDPLLQSVLAAQGGDYALPPSRASAFVGIAVLDHYLRGAYFPVGGSRALRDALVDGIRADGGVLLRNARVSKIELSDGRVRAVACSDGRRFEARVVISNADATVTYGDLVGREHLGPLARRKLARARHSLGSLCVFVGTDLDLRAAGMTDANIWHYGSVDLEGLYAPMFRGEPPEGELFFLSSPTLKDPATNHGAPPGHATLELVTLYPYEPFERWQGTRSLRRGEDYEAQKELLLERYWPSIERYVPGARAHALRVEVSTPLTNVSYALAPRGATYGLDHTPDQFGPFRFSTSGPVRGLFLCGSSVVGCGIVPSALSGYGAGRAAVRHLGRPVSAWWTRWAERLAPMLPA